MKDIFIVQFSEGDFEAGYKEDIEVMIKEAEELDSDLDWETVAKVRGIFANFDVTTKNIEWYKNEPDDQTKNKALFAIFQLLKNG